MGSMDPKAPDSDARPLLERLPRRNLRRALFLVIALLGVLAIKHAGGFGLGNLFESVAPSSSSPSYRLHVEPPAQR